MTFLALGLGLIEGMMHTSHVDGNQNILQLSGLPKGFPHPSPPRQELGFGVRRRALSESKAQTPCLWAVLDPSNSPCQEKEPCHGFQLQGLPRGLCLVTEAPAGSLVPAAQSSHLLAGRFLLCPSLL